MNIKTFLSIVAILVCELCERLTYFSLSGNLVLYCTNNLGYGNDIAQTITLVFGGICYFIPLGGGVVADSLIGRFHTIWTSLIFYVIGAAIIIPSSLDYLSLYSRRGYLIAGLFFIAIGTGGIKANVSPFGAQQVNDLGPKAVQSFFNWFYCFINIGALVALLGVAYIQQNIDFFYGYLIIFISISLSILVFVAPFKSYKRDKPQGSPLAEVIRIIIHANRQRGKTNETPPSFIHGAKERYGGKYSEERVNDVIKLVKIIPIFISFIVFWVIYNQMTTSYLLQSFCLNLQLGSITLPGASLGVFDTIIILIVSPFTDRVLYPLWKKKSGKEPNQFVRIAIGFFLSAAALVVAGGVEYARKEDIKNNGGFNQIVDNKTYLASNLSVFIQVPQYLLVGTGEVFASITGLEFAFSAAPERLKGVVMGLFLCTSGIGNFLSSVLLNIVNAASAPDKWIPDDINKGHLDWFCYLLAGLMIPNLIAFVFIAKWYESKSEAKHNSYRRLSAEEDSCSYNKHSYSSEGIINETDKNYKS